MLSKILITLNHKHVKVDIADAGKNNFIRSNRIYLVAKRIINCLVKIITIAQIQ